MNELSLFTGAGGGVLGTKLLGFNHIGYVEINEYCQRVIAQRIKDGILDEAPIFSDIRAFIDQGYASSYTGLVDIITAGFPCQPFSVAGKREGGGDDRNMWPETIEVIREIRPKIVLLENVPGLLTPVQRWAIRLIPKTKGWFRRIAIKIAFPSYFGRILRDMAACGFDARWRMLSAAEVGAPHKRDRLWIVAYTNSQGQSDVTTRTEEGIVVVADTQKHSQRPGLCASEPGQIGRGRSSHSGCAINVADTTIPRLQKREGLQPRRQETDPTIKTLEWWATEPDVGRVANGVANRVDRLKAHGNGQVPIVAKTAWQILTK